MYENQESDEMKKKYTADELIDRVHLRYGDSRRYVVFNQVAAGTGANAYSWIDAMVLHLWPSDGLIRSAFEVKVSRNDFLAELQKPGKNNWCREYCHEFWFVATQDVIKEDELPAGDGWLCPRGPGLAIVRHASRKQDTKVDDSIVASLARSMQKRYSVECNNIKKNVLAESHEYKKAKVYIEAVERFAKSHGKSFRNWGDDAVENVLTVLNECTSDIEIQYEREHVVQRLRAFQERLIDITDEVVMLAAIGLLEADDTGKYILDNWGYSKDEAVIMARETLKKNRYRDNGVNLKRKKEGYEFIIETAKNLLQSKKEQP